MARSSPSQWRLPYLAVLVLAVLAISNFARFLRPPSGGGAADGASVRRAPPPTRQSQIVGEPGSLSDASASEPSGRGSADSGSALGTLPLDLDSLDVEGKGDTGWVPPDTGTSSADAALLGAPTRSQPAPLPPLALDARGSGVPAAAGSFRELRRVLTGWGGAAEADAVVAALTTYKAWHARMRVAAELDPAHHRALVVTCPGGVNALCGGLADRLKGIVGAFYVALVSGRALYIHMPHPSPLHTLLATAEIDWRVPEVIQKHLAATGAVTQSAVGDEAAGSVAGEGVSADGVAPAGEQGRYVPTQHFTQCTDAPECTAAVYTRVMHGVHKGEAGRVDTDTVWLAADVEVVTTNHIIANLAHVISTCTRDGERGWSVLPPKTAPGAGPTTNVRLQCRTVWARRGNGTDTSARLEAYPHAKVLRAALAVRHMVPTALDFLFRPSADVYLRVKSITDALEWPSRGVGGAGPVCAHVRTSEADGVADRYSRTGYNTFASCLRSTATAALAVAPGPDDGVSGGASGRSGAAEFVNVQVFVAADSAAARDKLQQAEAAVRAGQPKLRGRRGSHSDGGGSSSLSNRAGPPRVQLEFQASTDVPDVVVRNGVAMQRAPPKGGNIAHIDKLGGRARDKPPAAVVHAAAEMVLLSACGGIVHSRSGYSELAAMWGGVPLLLDRVVHVEEQNLCTDPNERPKYARLTRLPAGLEPGRWVGDGGGGDEASEFAPHPP